MAELKPKAKKVVSSKKAVAKEPISSSATLGASLELAVFDQNGQEVEKINLPKEIFSLKINSGLIKQTIEAQLSQSRIPYAHAKDRSEVSGGGKKPWKQKGTGRARHGSSRSPIWKGGGVTHGPRKERNFEKKINKQMKRQALLMVLSGKARDNEIVVLNELKIGEAKTKLMANVVKNLIKVKSDLGKGALITMAQKDEKIIRATRNIPKIDTIGANSLNVVDLLSHKYLLMPKEAIDVIKKTYLK